MSSGYKLEFTKKPLVEITSASSDSLKRRWFSATGADLYVWFDENHAINRFEYCYDKPHDEHSLVWSDTAGMQHAKIDDGEGGPLENRTPIAIPNGSIDWAYVLEDFKKRASDIDVVVYRFILEKLYQYV